jgi:hypothetical protein
VAFTYRSSIDSTIIVRSSRMSCSCTWQFTVWQMTLCELAATDSKIIQSGYTRFSGVPGVGSYVDTSSLLVDISHWIEYACGVKSDTISLDRRVDLRWAWTSSLSEQRLSCILRISQVYMCGVSGYDTSTRYRLDSHSIPWEFDIYRAESVSGELRCRQRCCCAIGCECLNVVYEVNISNRFAILVSRASGLDKQQIIWIRVGDSCAPDNWNRSRRFRHHNLTRPMYDEVEVWLQPRQIDTKRHVWHCRIWLRRPLNRHACFSSHIGSFKWGNVTVYQISVYCWLHLICITIINKHKMMLRSNQYSSQLLYSPYRWGIIHQSVRLWWLNS